MKKYLLIISCTFVTLLGCTPYKVPIEQGNIMKPEMIDQLEIGMSRSQVEYIMGTPIIKDTFNGDRWDYIYTLKLNKQEQQQKRLTLFFKGDHLESYTGNALDKPKPEAEIQDDAKEAIEEQQNKDLEKKAGKISDVVEDNQP